MAISRTKKSIFQDFQPSRSLTDARFRLLMEQMTRTCPESCPRSKTSARFSSHSIQVDGTSGITRRETRQTHNKNTYIYRISLHFGLEVRNGRFSLARSQLALYYHVCLFIRLQKNSRFYCRIGWIIDRDPQKRALSECWSCFFPLFFFFGMTCTLV